MDISERLKELRSSRKLRQFDLADYLKCSRGVVSSYECGRSHPDLDTLAQIAQFYNVTVDYFLGLVKEPLPLDRDSLYISLPKGLLADEYDMIGAVSKTMAKQFLSKR